MALFIFSRLDAFKPFFFLFFYFLKLDFDLLPNPTARTLGSNVVE